MELRETHFRQRGDTWELLSDTNKLREAISELCKAYSEHFETKSELNGNILEHRKTPSELHRSTLKLHRGSYELRADINDL